MHVLTAFGCCRGFFELGPLLDYLTDILQDVISENGSVFFEQYFGQLNATYVQSNSALGPEIYVTLRSSGAYLPVSRLSLSKSLLGCSVPCSCPCSNHKASELSLECVANAMLHCQLQTLHQRAWVQISTVLM